MTLAMLFGAVWLAGALAPDTPVGRFLHRWIVVAPATRLARITPGQVALTVLIVVSVALSCFVVGEEMTRILGWATPEVASWIAMFEVTTYLDAVVAVVSASSVWRVGRGLPFLRLGRFRPGRRARRSRTTRPSPANDAGDAEGRAAA